MSAPSDGTCSTGRRGCQVLPGLVRQVLAGQESDRALPPHVRDQAVEHPEAAGMADQLNMQRQVKEAARTIGKKAVELLAPDAFGVRRRSDHPPGKTAVEEIGCIREVPVHGQFHDRNRAADRRVQIRARAILKVRRNLDPRFGEKPEGGFGDLP